MICMSDKALDNLMEIVDRLGPNMWLVLDEVALERYFGYGPTARDSLSAFAKRSDCTLVRDESKVEVKFGRAHYKIGRQ